MIIDFLVGFVLGVLDVLISLIPEWDPGYRFFNESGWAGTAGMILGSLNDFLPITEIGVALAILLAWSVATGAWAMLNWIYARLPLKGT